MMERELFEKQLKEYLQDKRNDLRERFNRVLPTGELLFDRFEKAKYLNMGQGSSIYDTSIVMGKIVAGKNVWIGPYTLIEGIHGKVTIGDFVSINTGVYIFTHDSTKYYISNGAEPFRKGDVIIGSNTVIGSMSMIGYDVAVGHHCIIAANSVVSRDVPDYTVVAGTPAVPIGHISIDSEGKVIIEYERKQK